MCGPNRSGAMGVNCARQLSSYGVHTVVVLSEPGLYTPQLANEMSLYQFTTGTLITSAAGNFNLLLYITHYYLKSAIRTLMLNLSFEV